jgi:hypothetical protein
MVYTQRYKVSAKDATTVTLVPVVDGDSSVAETGRAITQIVLTSTSLGGQEANELFFAPLNREIEVSFERK